MGIQPVQTFLNPAQRCPWGDKKGDCEDITANLKPIFDEFLDFGEFGVDYADYFDQTLSNFELDELDDSDDSDDLSQNQNQNQNRNRRHLKSGSSISNPTQDWPDYYPPSVIVHNGTIPPKKVSQMKLQIMQTLLKINLTEYVQKATNEEKFRNASRLFNYVLEEQVIANDFAGKMVGKLRPDSVTSADSDLEIARIQQLLNIAQIEKDFGGGKETERKFLGKESDMITDMASFGSIGSSTKKLPSPGPLSATPFVRTNRYGALLFGTNNTALLLVNTTAAHGSPVYLQLFLNLALQASRRGSNQQGPIVKKGPTSIQTGTANSGSSLLPKQAKYLTAQPQPPPTIIGAVHPLPVNYRTRKLLMNLQSFAIAFAIMISFGFVSAFAMVFIVQEKEEEIKIQQFINGLSIPSYWMANLLFDGFMYIFPILLILGALYLFKIDNLTAHLWPVLVLLFLFAFAMPPFSYIVAHFFKNASSALTISLTVNIIVGSLLFLVCAVFQLLPYVAVRKVGRIVHFFSMLWPLYTVGAGLESICILAAYWKKSGYPSSHDDQAGYWESCDAEYDNYAVQKWVCARSIWDVKYGIGQHLIFFAVEIFVYQLVAIGIDLAQQNFKLRQNFGRWLIMGLTFGWSRGSSSDSGGNGKTSALQKFNDLMLRYKRDDDVIAEEDFTNGRLADRNLRDGESAVNTSAYSVIVRHITKVFRIPVLKKKNQQNSPEKDEEKNQENLSSQNNHLTESQNARAVVAMQSGNANLNQNSSSSSSSSSSQIQQDQDQVPEEENQKPSCLEKIKKCPSKHLNSGFEPLYAVRDVSFSLKKGEVFGLLGVNGAGKSTLFRMLCGIEVPSAIDIPPKLKPVGNSNGGETGERLEKEPSEILINDKSIFSDRNACRKLIGYCAQANPLWPYLTVEEHLYFYARVKGFEPIQNSNSSSNPTSSMSSKERELLLQSLVNQQIIDMDLVEHRYKKAGQLSGGNKRKLMVAMSLICCPPVIFLDEPSAGMDPCARRKMWNIIQNVARKRKKSTVILTSHSLDEVQALSSRIGIMTHGIFRCFGEIQHIRAKYGRGFDLFVKFRVGELVERLVEKVLCVVKQNVQNSIQNVENTENQKKEKEISDFHEGAESECAESTLELEFFSKKILDDGGDVREFPLDLESCFVAFRKTLVSWSEVAEFFEQLDHLRKVKNVSSFPESGGGLNQEDFEEKESAQQKNPTQQVKWETNSFTTLLNSQSFPTNPFSSEESSVSLLVLLEYFVFSKQRIQLTTWVYETFAQMGVGSAESADIAGDSANPGQETLKRVTIEQFDTSLTYRIPVLLGTSGRNSRSQGRKEALGKGMSLGKVFGLVENVKALFAIGEYAITPTTLEEVFNGFARESEK